jgi:hypothetical protein
MKSNCPAATEDASPAMLAAELTDAIYAVALGYGITGSWIDLRLELWEVVTRTVERADAASAGCLDEFAAWREGFLAELIAVGYCAALRHGLRKPFLAVGRDLYQALSPLVARVKWLTM